MQLAPASIWSAVAVTQPHEGPTPSLGIGTRNALARACKAAARARASAPSFGAPDTTSSVRQRASDHAMANTPRHAGPTVRHRVRPPALGLRSTARGRNVPACSQPQDGKRGQPQAVTHNTGTTATPHP